MPLIVFEGIDGAGKTSISQQLAQYLHQRGWYTVWLREPGGTLIGEMVRRLIKRFQPGEHIDQRTEFLLFQASRAQMMKSVKFHLDHRHIVILDRYIYSTLVYQTLLNGVDRDWSEKVSDFATYSIMPDIAILLDIDAQTSVERTSQRDDNDLGWDEETLEKLRGGYLDLAKSAGYKMTILDGTLTQPDLLAHRVIPLVNSYIAGWDVVKHHPWSNFEDINEDLYDAQIDLVIEFLGDLIKEGRKK